MEATARSMLVQARKQRKLSLRDLASKVGISASQLSQIESGKSEPSVASLFALVAELDLSLDDLTSSRQGSSAGQIEAEPVTNGSAGSTGRQTRLHWRPADYGVLQLDSGVVWERLFASTDEILEALRVTYGPGGRSSSDGSFSRHEGSEFIHMLSGVLTIQLRFETFEAAAGDTVLFPASDPHYFVNNGEEPAVGLWLVLASGGLARHDAGLAEAGKHLFHHAGVAGNAATLTQGQEPNGRSRFGSTIT